MSQPCSQRLGRRSPARRAASRMYSSAPHVTARTLPSGNSNSTVNSRVVEPSVLRVWSLPWSPTPKVPRWTNDAVTLLREQLDEPRFVLDLLVQDPLRHVVCAVVLGECEIADLRPRANC